MRPLSKKNKILIIIVGILIVLSLNFFQKEVKGFFYFVSSPMQKTLWQIGGQTSDFFEFLTELKSLAKENTALNLKIQELIWENSSLKSLKEENTTLRKALSIGLEKDFRLELAEVIGKDIGQDTLLINKGLKDGLAKNLPVITSEKVLVGKIAEVYENFSKVILISDPDSVFDVKIIDSNTEGILKGLGALKISLDFLPQQASIQQGQVLVSSVLGGVYPANLLVGWVEDFQKNDVKAFQQADVKPFFNLADLNKVFVILEF